MGGGWGRTVGNTKANNNKQQNSNWMRREERWDGGWAGMTGTGLVDCIYLSPSVFVALALFVCVCRRWISIPHTHTKEGENPDQRPPFPFKRLPSLHFPTLSLCVDLVLSLSHLSLFYYSAHSLARMPLITLTSILQVELF